MINLIVWHPIRRINMLIVQPYHDVEKFAF